MMALKNLHREYASVNESTSSALLHHELSQSITNRKAGHIYEMMKYIEDIGSPFSAGSLSAVELHNKRDDDRRDQKLSLMHQKQARRSMRHSTVTESLKKKLETE